MTFTKFKQQLAAQGFKPWGLVIPGGAHDPQGSKLYQFRCGKREANAVVTPRGRLIRAVVVNNDGTRTYIGKWRNAYKVTYKSGGSSIEILTNDEVRYLTTPFKNSKTDVAKVERVNTSRSI